MSHDPQSGEIHLIRKYRIKLKRIAQFWISPFRPLFRDRVYTIRSGPAKGLKRKGGFGFLPFFPDEEDKFYREFDMRDMVAYDIGANVGIMSILFAKKVGPKGYVHCFEPNPESAALVSEILDLNRFQNAEVHHVAIGDKKARATLVVHSGQIGTGSLNREITEKYIRQGDNRLIEVDVYPLDIYVDEKKLPFPDFVKIDTEGYEFQCLAGMDNILATKHPQLIIEMHAISDANAEKNARSVIGLLEKHRYSIYSLRNNENINQANWRLAISGHLFCR